MPVFPGDRPPALQEFVDEENEIVHYAVNTGSMQAYTWMVLCIW